MTAEPTHWYAVGASALSSPWFALAPPSAPERVSTLSEARPPPKPVDLAFAEATRRCGVDACCAAARVSPRAVEDVRDAADPSRRRPSLIRRPSLLKVKKL